MLQKVSPKLLYVWITQNNSAATVIGRKGVAQYGYQEVGDILVADQWIILISHNGNIKGEQDEPTAVQDTVCQMMSYLVAIVHATDFQRNI